MMNFAMPLSVPARKTEQRGARTPSSTLLRCPAGLQEGEARGTQYHALMSALERVQQLLVQALTGGATQARASITGDQVLANLPVLVALSEERLQQFGAWYQSAPAPSTFPKPKRGRPRKTCAEATSSPLGSPSTPASGIFGYNLEPTPKRPKSVSVMQTPFTLAAKGARAIQKKSRAKQAASSGGSVTSLQDHEEESDVVGLAEIDEEAEEAQLMKDYHANTVVMYQDRHQFKPELVLALADPCARSFGLMGVDASGITMLSYALEWFLRHTLDIVSKLLRKDYQYIASDAHVEVEPSSDALHGLALWAKASIHNKTTPKPPPALLPEPVTREGHNEEILPATRRTQIVVADILAAARLSRLFPRYGMMWLTQEEDLSDHTAF
ncbi:uncharacterized protein MONBRDRAFT_32012 [Monosiga brevicollis MX1]|uniref:Uncharacterized protein n=1 Tax=Monosiga brevicollis TaxID=81824 RepID=A9UWV6_MONBE|nr:uncharacterized protein MONBRDRAFT_32012 [Monosiga brevicollis MX1]EDQ90109.1 predicted protein [Monosiga brevicollis MX1]|eukprot:XP_001744876.1 hypothetical protein [Monosiga brevicollis MX1]